MRGLWRRLPGLRGVSWPGVGSAAFFWKEKAAKLRIPLSEKGHEVSQTGSFTGLAIDTFRGVFSMLPDKLASTVAAVEEMRAATRTTPRPVARVRGKVLHYGAAVPFIAVAAA